MTDSAITRAREAEKLLRLRFEAEKQAEWQRVSSSAKAAVDHAVWYARFVEGKNVSQIAREYGTKNRNTIYEILNKMESVQSIQEGTREGISVSVSPDSAPVADGFPNGYRVQTNKFRDFRSQRALDAAGGVPVSSWVQVWVKPDGTVKFYAAENEFGPLHLEVVDATKDSVIVKAITDYVEKGGK